MKQSHKTKFPVWMLVLGLILGAFFTLVGLRQPEVALAATVCPEGGDWTSHDTDFPYTFTANPGYVIDAICVKGGSADVSLLASSNGYIHTFYSNGWYIHNDVECVLAAGIGTGTAGVTHSGVSGSICAGISHASFRVTEEEKQDTPTPTNTSTPTETETPTPTSTDPSKEETPTPTQTGTLTKEDTPTPTATDAPKEETPTPKPSATEAPKVEPTPDIAAGGAGPSFTSILALIMIIGGGSFGIAYLAKKIKQA